MSSAEPHDPTREGGDSSARGRILDAALAIFAENGFDGTTTRAIAGRADVNLGLIPYYFDGKEGLWREAVDRAFERLRLGLGDVVREAGRLDPRGRVELLIRSYVAFVARNPEFVKLMHQEGKREGARMQWLVDRHVKPLYQATAELVESAASISRLPAGTHPLHFHYILAGAVGVIFHQAPECRRLTGRDPCDDDVIEAHADALVAMLLREPEGEPEK